MDFYQHAIVDVAQLVPYALNSRNHSDEQVAQLAASIRAFGFTNPILVDEHMNLVAGHGRLLAARKLKMKQVPAIVVTGMDERKRRALVIADNKLALNATWDEAALKVEIQDLGGEFGALMGFSSEDLGEILGLEGEGAAVAVVDPTDPSIYGGGTSLERGSAPLRYWREQGYLEGKVLDFGCGKEEHDFSRYDMVTQPDTDVLLDTFDVVLCSYVLNVQPSDHLIDLLCLVLRSLCPGGRVLVAVVTDKSLSGGRACGGREAKGPAEWAGILERFFDVEKANSPFTGFVCRAKPGRLPNAE